MLWRLLVASTMVVGLALQTGCPAPRQAAGPQSPGPEPAADPSGGGGDLPGGGATGGSCEAGNVNLNELGFNIPGCMACVQEKCCNDLSACSGDAECSQCSQSMISTEPACVDSENYGQPGSLYNVLRRCQNTQCGCGTPGSPCCGKGGSSCSRSNCGVGCPGYPNCP